MSSAGSDGAGPAADAVTANKYYVALVNSQSLFYPVKSNLTYLAKRWGPKRTRRSRFCAGQPQFFGGREDVSDGDISGALDRETKEESINTYRLFGPVIGPPLLSDDHTDEETGERTTYTFFSTHRFIRAGDWPDENKWKNLPRKSKEMCWVATIDWMAFNANMTDYDIGMTLLNNARLGAPRWAMALMADRVSEEYMISFTSTAFGKLVRGNLQRLARQNPQPPP